MRAVLAVVVLVAVPALPASSADTAPGAAAKGADINTVLLDPRIDGTRVVRVVGLQALRMPLGRKGFQAWQPRRRPRLCDWSRAGE